MKGRKIVYLFLALGVPLLLATFFKYCTTPQFDVPVLFEENSPLGEKCGLIHPVPYTVPDSMLLALGWQKEKKLTFVFLRTGVAEEEGRLKWLNKEKDSMNILEMTSEIKAFNDCYFFLSEDSSSMLVDHLRRVRAYYGPSRRETDRLEAEVKILLSK